MRWSSTRRTGTGRIKETPYYWGVHEDVYCAGKEEVFQFLEEVLREVIAIFPCTYFHIGGDEVIRHNSVPCSCETSCCLLPFTCGHCGAPQA